MDKALRNDEDIELIKEVLEGNAIAFTRLMQKYKNMVFNLAYRVTGDLAEAEDVIQESFVRVYRSMKQFNPLHAFSNWLYTITINVCKSRNRKKKFMIFSLDSKAVNREDHEEWAPEMEGGGGNPEEALINEESEKRAQKIINSLPFKYRTIFVLRYIDNKSYQEIASCTELPLGTVKTYLYRGQKILCEKLKKHN